MGWADILCGAVQQGSILWGTMMWCGVPCRGA